MPKRATVTYKPIDEISDLFNDLPPEQKDYLRQNCTIRHLKKNEFVHKEGEAPAYLFCLLKGILKITKVGVGGRAQIVRMIKPVNYTGYRAIFAEDNYITSAMAVEPSDVYFIEVEAFRNLVFHCPQLSYYFLKQLALDLGEADLYVVNLTQKHIRGRLAEALCRLIDYYGYEHDNVTLGVYLSREDLANLSNMTVSNAIRILSAFAKNKLITIDGRIIKVINEEGLRHISRFG